MYWSVWPEMKARNIVFSFAITIFLCGPVLMLAVESCGKTSLPSWFTAEDANYLSGGKSNISELKENLSLSGFLSGGLQSSIENEVSQYIPAKSVALLGSAYLQYESIAFSNVLFGWDALPTFYGSSIVYNPSTSMLLEIPSKKSADQIARMKDFAYLYEEFAERHEQQKTFLYLCPTSSNLDDGPVSSLVCDPLTYSDLFSIFENEGETLACVSGRVSFSQFSKDWYKTDHHWDIDGAYKGYVNLLAALRPDDKPLEAIDKTVYADLESYGSLARRALYLGSYDRVSDYQFDCPQYEIEIDGKPATLEDLAHRELYESGSWGSNPFVGRYGEYFHYDKGIITIKNIGGEPTGGTLLLVADSYSNSIERLLAAHYSTVYVVDPRKLDESLDAFMKQHEGIQDVVFLMSAQYLTDNVMRSVLAPDLSSDER